MGAPILFITHTPTHPPNAGNRVRFRRLIDEMAALGHEVHLLVAGWEPGDPQAMRAWLGDRLYLVSYNRPRRKETRLQRMGRWLRQTVDPDARYLWRLDDWYDPALDAVIDRLHGIHQYRAVVVLYVFFSRAFERFGPEVLKVLDAQDSVTLRHRSYLESGMKPVFFSTTAAEEARGLDRADLVLAIQDTERAFFSRISRSEIITVGHMVDVDPQYGGNREGGSFNVLFMGSANDINIAGLRNFLRDAWPEVRRRLPQARLLLAGKVCGADLGDADMDVQRLGYVEDKRSAYRQADIVINPVPHGTGLNIKSIEALGYGMPFIASPAGARGLESATGRAVIVAATLGDMVTAIERLHGDPEQRRRLSAAAVEFAREWNFTALQRLIVKLG